MSDKPTNLEQCEADSTTARPGLLLGNGTLHHEMIAFCISGFCGLMCMIFGYIFGLRDGNLEMFSLIGGLVGGCFYVYTIWE